MGKFNLTRNSVFFFTILLFLSACTPVIYHAQANDETGEILGDPDTMINKVGLKDKSKLNYELQKILETYQKGLAVSDTSQSYNLNIEDDMVSVYIYVDNVNHAVLTVLEEAGVIIENSDFSTRFVKAWIPISQLETVSKLPVVERITTPIKPTPTIINEGVRVINADCFRSLGYTGTGVKVAVLDGGFTGYASLLGSELPATVTVQSFHPDGIEGNSEHGTACAELIYDIAPDVQLCLVNFDELINFNNAVDWLISQNVGIISCSISWFNLGAYDGTGPVDEIIDNARFNHGILWVNSAGNEQQKHWSGTFTNNISPEDGWHEFAPDDETQDVSLTAGNTYAFRLSWDDPYGGSSNDYDFYLLDPTRTTVVAWSDVTQNGDDNPTESFIYSCTSTGIYHLAIHRFSATRDVTFDLFTDVDLQYITPEGSIPNGADAEGALTVGATYWEYDTLESFSSMGPTKDGRIKPELVAPDGVATVTYSTFYGTSASAPLVAGAAALLIGSGQAVTADEVEQLLKDTAVDLGSVGADNSYGWGRIILNSPILLGAVAVPPTSFLGDYLKSGDTVVFFYGMTDISDVSDFKVQHPDLEVIYAFTSKDDLINNIASVPSNIDYVGYLYGQHITPEFTVDRAATARRISQLAATVHSYNFNFALSVPHVEDGYVNGEANLAAVEWRYGLLANYVESLCVQLGYITDIQKFARIVSKISKQVSNTSPNTELLIEISLRENSLHECILLTRKVNKINTDLNGNIDKIVIIYDQSYVRDMSKFITLLNP